MKWPSYTITSILSFYQNNGYIFILQIQNLHNWKGSFTLTQKQTKFAKNKRITYLKLTTLNIHIHNKSHDFKLISFRKQ